MDTKQSLGCPANIVDKTIFDRCPKGTCPTLGGMSRGQNLILSNDSPKDGYFHSLQEQTHKSAFNNFFNFSCPEKRKQAAQDSMWMLIQSRGISQIALP